MKKYIIPNLVLILSVLLIFSGCENEGNKEVVYPIDFARYYTETEEHGVIAVKTDVTEFIEIIYTSEDGTIKKSNKLLSMVDIGTENIIIIKNEGKFFEYPKKVILTEDYYNKICGIEYVKNESAPEPTTKIETELTSETTTEPEPEYVFYDAPLNVETQKQISDICSEYGLKYELILGVISVESDFNSDTIGDGGNSFGLMQIQPKWWGDLMAQEGITDILDPLQNVRLGCAIIKELQAEHGTEYRALQSYNTGNADSRNGYADKVYRHMDNLTVLDV